MSARAGRAHPGRRQRRLDGGRGGRRDRQVGRGRRRAGVRRAALPHPGRTGQVSGQVRPKIAADESIRRADDPAAVRLADAADVAIVKVAPLGGVRAALGIAAAAGVPAVVSSAVDSAVGLAAGVALAAALPELPYACGLGTGMLLAADVSADPPRPVGGFLDVATRAPDPDLYRPGRGRRRPHGVLDGPAAPGRRSSRRSRT